MSSTGTEAYTDYESHYECKSVPVSRMRSEQVTRTQCNFVPVTHTVTRYEFQLENEYKPAHLEQITRQRLRELDPVCYAIDETDVAGPGVLARRARIEGTLFGAR